MLPGNWFLNDKSCISNRHFSTHFQAVNKKIVLHSFQIIAADHYHLQWLSGRRRIAKMTQSCRCWKCWAQLSLLFELKYLNSGHNRLRNSFLCSSWSVIWGEVCVWHPQPLKKLTSVRLRGNRLKERRRALSLPIGGIWEIFLPGKRKQKKRVSGQTWYIRDVVVKRWPDIKHSEGSGVWPHQRVGRRPGWSHSFRHWNIDHYLLREI